MVLGAEIEARENANRRLLEFCPMELVSFVDYVSKAQSHVRSIHLFHSFDSNLDRKLLDNGQLKRSRMSVT